MKWLLWCTLFMLNTSNASEQQASPDWLKTVAFAGHLTDFSGVFVYQYNDRIETYRISHVVASDSEYEKVISLDGPKQEIIRHHGQTWCYRNHKMVQVASQQGKAKFPTILIDQLSNLNDSYLVQDAGTSNVAGYATRVIIFQPKDKLRYSHQIWVNTDTGLLLKSVVLDDKKQVLEQYVFTQLKIGVEADRTWLPETKADNRLSLPTTKTDAAISTNSGWVVDSLPQGFTK
jgi:sigma-E factor negative regulatory protein RseB